MSKLQQYLQDLRTKFEEEQVERNQEQPVKPSDSDSDDQSVLSLIAKYQKTNKAEKVFDIKLPQSIRLSEYSDMNQCAVFLDALAWLYSSRVDKAYQDSLKLKCNLLRVYDSTAIVAQRQRKQAQAAKPEISKVRQNYTKIEKYGEQTLDFRTMTNQYDTVQLNPFYNQTSKSLDLQDLSTLIMYKPQYSSDMTIIIDPIQLLEISKNVAYHSGFIKLEIDTTPIKYDDFIQGNLAYNFQPITDFRERYTYLLNKKQKEPVFGALAAKEIEQFLSKYRVNLKEFSDPQSILKPFGMHSREEDAPAAQPSSNAVRDEIAQDMEENQKMLKQYKRQGSEQIQHQFAEDQYQNTGQHGYAFERIEQESLAESVLQPSRSHSQARSREQSAKPLEDQKRNERITNTDAQRQTKPTPSAAPQPPMQIEQTYINYENSLNQDESAFQLELSCQPAGAKQQIEIRSEVPLNQNINSIHQQSDLKKHQQQNANLENNPLFKQPQQGQSQPLQKKPDTDQQSQLPEEEIPDLQQAADEWEQHYLEEQLQEQKEIQAEEEAELNQQFQASLARQKKMQKRKNDWEIMNFDDAQRYERTILMAAIQEQNKLNRNVRIRQTGDYLADFQFERFFEFFVRDIDFQEVQQDDQPANMSNQHEEEGLEQDQIIFEDLDLQSNLKQNNKNQSEDGQREGSDKPIEEERRDSQVRDAGIAAIRSKPIEMLPNQSGEEIQIVPEDSSGDEQAIEIEQDARGENFEQQAAQGAGQNYYQVPFRVVQRQQGDPITVKQLQNIIEKTLNFIPGAVVFSRLHNSMPLILDTPISKHKLFASLLFVCKHRGLKLKDLTILK